MVGAAVTEFHKLMGAPAPTAPVASFYDSDHRTSLRIDLMREEWKEMMDALAADDVVGFLKEAVDLVYVVAGTCVEAGLPFDEAFAAVHASNMAKAPDCNACNGRGWYASSYGPSLSASFVCKACAGKGRIVRFRDDGKVMKPVGWEAPNISDIIWKETDARHSPSA